MVELIDVSSVLSEACHPGLLAVILGLSQANASYLPAFQLQKVRAKGYVIKIVLAPWRF